MPSTANIFRRKQDAILGVDVSNHTSRPTSQATLSRHDTLRSISGRSTRTVGLIPAGISHIPHIPEEDDELTPESEEERDTDSIRFMDIRRETESLYSRGSGEASYRESTTMSPDSERFDPLNEDEEEEEDDEEYDSLDDDFSIYAGSISRSKTVASKRLQALREGGRSARSSSALGFRSSSTDSGMALPSKAERMLGMAANPVIASRGPSVALRPRASKTEKGILPSKAQRLLGVRADTVAKSKRLQQERESSVGSAGMAMNRSGSDVDDFRRMLLIGEKGRRRMGKADSTSDASSMSRNSLLESQTSRSSRELLSPDADIPTWTSANSTAAPWMGIHPALRGRKPSSEYEGMSPISPFTMLGRDAGYSGKMVVSDFSQKPQPTPVKINSVTDIPATVVELDAGPPSPVELPAFVGNGVARSLPSVLSPTGTSSAPSSPLLSGRPISSKSDNRAADDMLAPLSTAAKTKQRPSAIFDNPNIFEMPADPITPPKKSKKRSSGHGKKGNRSKPPQTPPSADKKDGSAQGSSPAAAPRSPFPPPQRPLPAPPQRRRDSETLAILPPVAFDVGRTRKHSDDVPISPRSTGPKQEKTGENHKEPSSADREQPPLKLDKFSVPSPLAMALAAGKPVTKTAPPPLPSPDDKEEQGAATSEKKRVELSDKASSARKQASTKDVEPEYRPFSWQSTRTARSMTTEEDAPPMPPPLALQIPTDAVRRATAQARGCGTITATPLTATSARSRASRLEKALESALSKEGMEKALSGEKIEDLFRSAGADELFASAISPRVEGMTQEEDDEDAKHAATRAQGLLGELSALQREVDQLRKLYEPGGPLEGESPLQ